MVSISHYVTWQLGKRFPRAIPLVFVVGFPKSGTTWACQLVAAYLRLPFPKLSLLPFGFPAVVHGHELVEKKYPYCVYVLRDGRDAMTSLYYHIQRGLLRGQRLRIPRKYHAIFLDGVDTESVQKNFPRFLEIQIQHPMSSRYSWSEHVTSYLESDQPKLAGLKYEELLSDGPDVLAREMSKLDGQQPDVERARFFMNDFSFSSGKKQEPDADGKRSFLRKGIAGDWRNHFSRESAQIFDHYCGVGLISAGYETDSSWIDGLPTS